MGSSKWSWKRPVETWNTAKTTNKANESISQTENQIRWILMMRLMRDISFQMQHNEYNVTNVKLDVLIKLFLS